MSRYLAAPYVSFPEGTSWNGTQRLAVNLELEGAVPDHVPRDALRGREDDRLRLRVLHKLRTDPILRIRWEVCQTLEFLPQGVGDRGRRVFLEPVVLLPSHGLDLFDVVLVGVDVIRRHRTAEALRLP